MEELKLKEKEIVINYNETEIYQRNKFNKEKIEMLE